MWGERGKHVEVCKKSDKRIKSRSFACIDFIFIVNGDEGLRTNGMDQGSGLEVAHGHVTFRRVEGRRQ